MTVTDVTLDGGRKGRIYRADETTERGLFCSLTELRPELGNRLLGSGYLRRPPKRDSALARTLEEMGIRP